MPHELPLQEKSIHVDNSEIPELSVWENGRRYNITYKNIQQVRRVENLDGTVEVKLVLDDKSEVIGEASELV